jgi:polyhydroxybutyrate depolymerase
VPPSAPALRRLGLAALLLALVLTVIVGAVSARRDPARPLEVDGRSRTYVPHVPATETRRGPMPLVLVFHGGQGSPTRVASTTRFSELADREGFVVAYPQAYQGHWNDGRGTMPAARDSVDDVAFARAIVDQLTAELDIDERRIYAVGLSNGGMFAQRLGCELADRLAAIATVVGPMAAPLAETCALASPISVLSVAGTKDPLIPWDGGEVQIGARGEVLGAEATADLWGRLNGCGEPAERIWLPASDGEPNIWSEARGNCTDGVQVVLYGIEGGGHSWPPQRAFAGASTPSFTATDVIWEFLKEHPKAPRTEAVE